MAFCKTSWQHMEKTHSFLLLEGLSAQALTSEGLGLDPTSALSACALSKLGRGGNILNLTTCT